MNNDNTQIIEEIRTMLESKLEVIDYKLDTIFEQTKKTNGRVTQLEKKTNDLDLTDKLHVASCPQIKKIETMQKELDNQKNIKNWLIKAMGVIGGMLGLLFSLDKIFGIFSGK
jgi:peptidoglycan hydrolase CwlO-like protein